jgi:DNA-binding MarR family transcriptional regulator
MSSDIPAELFARFAELGRESSTLTVMFHTRIAEQMGLSGTDHKCLDLAMRADEPITAGRLAELSGLSTGAVTGVIDRLERRGFVRRVRDPYDRRKVLIEVSEEDPERFAHLFGGVVDTMRKVMEQFTPEELEVVERYQRALLDEMRSMLNVKPAAGD